MFRIAIILGIALILTPQVAQAYIDPATGNALLTLSITLLSALLIGIQYLYDNFFLIKTRFSKSQKKVPLIVYSEGNIYWTVFEPILDELEKRKIKTEFYTSDKDDKVFNKKYEYIHPTFIGAGNKGYFAMSFVKADVVLMTTPGLDVYQMKRSKFVRKYAHVFHGLGDGCDYRLFGLDYYDTLLMDNEINKTYVRELEKKRHLPAKNLVTVGCILLDRLKTKLKNNQPIDKANPTVLVAPSWGKQSLLYRHGDELLENLIKQNYKIVVRPHPQTKIDNPELLERLKNKFAYYDKLEWNYDIDNMQVMADSSIMISDFSGIVLEYAFVFKKPVIVFNQKIDVSIYDAADLDEPTWKLKVTDEFGKRIGEEDIPHIHQIIQSFMNTDISSKIDKISQKYWMEQGKCVENIVDYLEKEIGAN